MMPCGPTLTLGWLKSDSETLDEGFWALKWHFMDMAGAALALDLVVIVLDLIDQVATAFILMNNDDFTAVFEGMGLTAWRSG